MTEKSLNSNLHKVNKAKILGEIRKSLCKVTDGMGKKIDSGIMDTVLYLNALGINTTASCEGHVGWGLPGPWVNFAPASKAYTKAKEESRRLYIKADALSKKNKKAADVIFKKRWKYMDLVNGFEGQEADKVLKLLVEFYKDRKVDLYTMLVVQNGGLVSQGVNVIDGSSKAIKKAKLPLYQKEMHDFTQFLKKKYETK